MRRIEVAACAVALAAGACVVKLRDDAVPIHVDAGSDDAGAVTGCVPLIGPNAGASGDLRSIASGESILFVADHVDASGARTPAPGFLAARPAGADCAWSLTSIGGLLAPSPIRADAILAPLDPVATDAGLALYYTAYVPDQGAPFGVRSIGVGVAPHDAAAGRFVPSSELLWSGDRAPYGASALRVGDVVYAIGCVSSGPFADDCFVARAPAAGVASADAYTYFDGAGWSPNPDRAAAVVHDAGAANVRFDAATSRFVMTYVPPLGKTIVARTSIAPEGPWSAPRTLAACDLPKVDGVFCGGAQQHALDGLAAGSIAVTYGARSFTSVDPAAAAAHLVVLAVP